MSETNSESISTNSSDILRRSLLKLKKNNYVMPQDSFINAVENFLKSEQRFLLVYGQQGSGKTLFCHYIMQWILNNDKDKVPVYINLASISDLKQNFISNIIANQLGNKLETIIETQVELVIIFDGYGENSQYVNLWLTQQLMDWVKTKVIVTCRPHYLKNIKSTSLPYYFLPYKNLKPLYEICQLTLPDFDVVRIVKYIQTVCKNPTNQLSYLEIHSDLKKLFANPLMLTIWVKSFEKIETSKSLNEVYDIIIRHWLTYQVCKLKKIGCLVEDDIDIIEKTLAYCQVLLKKMQNFSLSEIITQPRSRLFHKNIDGNDLIYTDDPNSELMFNMLPIYSITPHQYRFFTSAIAEFILKSELHLKKAAKFTDSFATEQLEPKQLINVSSPEYSRLHYSLIEENIPLLQLLADRVKEDKMYKAGLFDHIYFSRQTDDQQAISRASNAITILNCAKISFAREDLSYIQIPYAILTRANLHNTNLAFANLKNVNLQYSFLVGTNFNNSVMSDVILGEGQCLLHEDEVCSTIINTERNSLVTASANHIYLWDMKGSLICRSLDNESQHTKTINSLAFSLDGRHIVSGSDDKKIKLWDATNLICLRTWSGHESGISCVAISKRMQIVSASRDKCLRLWSFNDTNCINQFRGHLKTVTSAVFFSEGDKLLSGSLDGTIRMWNAFSAECLKIWRVNDSGITSIALAAHELLFASGGHDSSVRVWNIVEGDCVKIWQEHQASVTSVAFSNDGSMVASSSFDQTVRLFNLENETSIHIWKVHKDEVLGVKFITDTQLISWSADKTVIFLELKSTQLASSSAKNTIFSSNAFAYAPSRQYVAYTIDKVIHIWSLHYKSPIQQFVGHEDTIAAIAYSGNEQLLASGSLDCTARLWEFGQTFPIKVWRHSYPVDSVCFFPNGQQIATVSRRLLQIWGIQSDQCLLAWPWCTNVEFNIAVFSPITNWLASGCSKGKLEIWEVREGDCLQVFSLQAHINELLRIVFSPVDGDLLASVGKDKQVKIWKIGHYHPLRVWQLHKKFVSSLCFSSDGNWLATGSYDKQVYIFDVIEGTLIHSLKHPRKVVAVAFCSNKRNLIVNTKAGLFIWKYHNNDWLLKRTNCDLLIIDNIQTANVVGLPKESILLRQSETTNLTTKYSGPKIDIRSFNNRIQLPLKSYVFSYPVTIKSEQDVINISVFYEENSLPLSDIQKFLARFSRYISKWSDVKSIITADNILHITPKDINRLEDLKRTLVNGIDIFKREFNYFIINDCQLNFFFVVKENLNLSSYQSKFKELIIRGRTFDDYTKFSINNSFNFFSLSEQPGQQSSLPLPNHLSSIGPSSNAYEQEKNSYVISDQLPDEEQIQLGTSLGN